MRNAVAFARNGQDATSHNARRAARDGLRRAALLDRVVLSPGQAASVRRGRPRGGCRVHAGGARALPVVCGGGRFPFVWENLGGAFDALRFALEPAAPLRQSIVHVGMWPSCRSPGDHDTQRHHHQPGPTPNRASVPPCRRPCWMAPGYGVRRALGEYGREDPDVAARRTRVALSPSPWEPESSPRRHG